MLAARRSRPETVTSFQLLTAIASAVIASTVMLGWITGTPRLTIIFPNAIAMNPMTAIGILSVSAGLLLRARRHSAKVRLLGGVTAFIGTAKLAQVMLGLPTGIDQLIFADQLLQVDGSRSRIATNTAFALATIGLGLATSNARRGAIILLSQFLCVASAMTASAALVGYGPLRELMAEAQAIAHMLAGTAAMVGEAALGDLAASADAKIALAIRDDSAAAISAARAAIEGLAAALRSDAVPAHPLQARKG